MSEPAEKRLRTLGELCEDGTDGGCARCGCKDLRRIGKTDKEVCRHCNQSVRTIAAK